MNMHCYAAVQLNTCDFPKAVYILLKTNLTLQNSFAEKIIEIVILAPFS